MIYTAKQVRSSNDFCPVYIVLFSNDTDFGKIIRKVTGSEYSHAVISLDSTLNNMYSFSSIPFAHKFADSMGFVRESLWSPMFEKNRFFTIMVTFVSKEEKNIIQSKIDYFIQHYRDYKYNEIGLIQYYLNFKEKYNHDEAKKKKWFCSEFVSYMLKAGHVKGFDDILLAPQDIMEKRSTAGVIDIGTFTISTFSKEDLDRKTIAAKKEFMKKISIAGPTTENYYFEAEVINESIIKDIINNFKNKEEIEDEVMKYTALIDWKYLYDQYIALFPTSDSKIRFALFELIIRKIVIPSKVGIFNVSQEICKYMKNLYSIIGCTAITSIDVSKGFIYTNKKVISVSALI